MKKIKNKPINKQVIVITGASSGIGLATAKMAAAKGASVVLASRNEDDLRRIVKTFNLGQGKSIYAVADVSKLADVEKIRDLALSEFGRIDTWVNNAGVSIYGYLRDESFEEEKQLFETNFWGVRHGCQVALPILAQQSGVLINVGSEVSVRSIPLQGIYAASKHAVKAYTDALRMEVIREKIPVAVCLVSPTGIDTPYTEHARNELPEGSPSLPGPVYHPYVVARAILKCAQRPQRDVYIGGTSRLVAVLDVLFPKMMDQVMELSLFKKQFKGSKVPHTLENEGLMHAPHREGRITGGHDGVVLNNSMYASMKSHRAVVWMAVSLAAFAAYGFFKPEKVRIKK
jgi:short-subunit dehydrogenase